jgi:hypothetical protein
MLKRVFGPKRVKLTGEWRRLDEIYDLCSSPTIIRVIKSRRMRRAEHLTLVGEGRDVYRVLAEKTERKRPL